VERRLLGLMEERAEAISGSFYSKDLANTLWAYATLGSTPAGSLLRALEERVEVISGLFIAQEISNTLWAYARFFVKRPKEVVFRLLERRAEEVSGDFNAQAVANTLWAYATMGRQPGHPLLAALARRAEEIAGTFTLQNVTNTLWAACFLSIESPELAGSLAGALASNSCLSAIDPSSLSDKESLCQLHQFLTAIDLDDRLRASTHPTFLALKHKLGAACKAARKEL